MPNYHTLFNIQGQTAVITGGSGGLGSAIAYALAGAGARVAVISLHATSSAKVVETIRADGREAIGIACDVMNRADLERAYTRVLDSFDLCDGYSGADRWRILGLQWSLVTLRLILRHLLRQHQWEGN